MIKPGDEDIHTANERRLKVSYSLYVHHNFAEECKIVFHQIRLSDSS